MNDEPQESNKQRRRQQISCQADADVNGDVVQRGRGRGVVYVAAVVVVPVVAAGRNVACCGGVLVRALLLRGERVEAVRAPQEERRTQSAVQGESVFFKSSNLPLASRIKSNLFFLPILLPNEINEHVLMSINMMKIKNQNESNNT